MSEFSKSQLDRLGSRLRKTDRASPEDTALYFDYRDEFTESLEEVKQRLAQFFPGSLPSGRRKTLDSVVAKMQRQRTRLSTMQDIVGCRIVVPGLAEQDDAVSQIGADFDVLRTDDLRDTPHTGYRAVHAIVSASNKRQVEIQVRKDLQDLHAQMVEKMADRILLGIKYGHGPAKAIQLAVRLGDLAARLDSGKSEIALLERRLEEASQSLEAEGTQAQRPEREALLASVQSVVRKSRAKITENDDDYRAFVSEILTLMNASNA
ncbi:MAG: ppGpp synthetase catalytic domain-containing protein (RelA/SpoT-type nucleotidyltransferase) [Chloroflexi bacterium]|nr:MAG: ppGpp synthetase catalytic domain-containing protein (RelA/SpoT-type nucleotidyltransferase) [Chloroflexota bacterium]